jgi:hypothetical protein
MSRKGLGAAWLQVDRGLGEGWRRPADGTGKMERYILFFDIFFFPLSCVFPIIWRRWGLCTFTNFLKIRYLLLLFFFSNFYYKKKATDLVHGHFG